MRRPTAIARLGGACLAATVLLLGACSGDEDGATAEGTETPTPTQVIQAASPADLKSYRYDLTVSILTSLLDTSEAPGGLPLDGELWLSIQGERVNPDREHSVASANLGFLQVDTEAIVIGDRRWLREVDGTWREGATSPLESFAGLDFRPSVLFADDAGQYDEIARRLNEYEWVEEDLFGIPTRHFTLDEEAFIALFQSQEDVLPMELDATLTAEIWLERDLGTPVQLLVVGVDAAGTEVVRLHLGLRDLNSDDIAISPPQ